MNDRPLARASRLGWIAPALALASPAHSGLLNTPGWSAEGPATCA